MTFDEFQNQAIDSDNVCSDDLANLSGRIYPGNLYIIKCGHDNWWLRLPHGEEISQDLTSLELQLYQFACDEDIIMYS